MRDEIDRRKMSQEFNEKLMLRLSDIEIQIATLAQQVQMNHKAFRDAEAESRRISERLVNTIYGNGHKGITTYLSDVAGTMKTHQEEFKEHKNMDLRFYGLFTMLLVSILGWTIFHH